MGRYQPGEGGNVATRFQPGESGNPTGLPKGIGEVRELARTHTKAAIGKLAALMEGGESGQVQLMAANALLDRGWGRPAQPFAGDDAPPPVRIDVRVEFLRLLNSFSGARHQGDVGHSDPGGWGRSGGALAMGTPLLSTAMAEGGALGENAGGNGADSPDRLGNAAAPKTDPSTR